MHLLNEGHFKRKEENQLIIEDARPVNFMNGEDEAIDMLKKNIIKQFFLKNQLSVKYIYSQIAY